MATPSNASAALCRGARSIHVTKSEPSTPSLGPMRASLIWRGWMIALVVWASAAAAAQSPSPADLVVQLRDQVSPLAWARVHGLAEPRPIAGRWYRVSMRGALSTRDGTGLLAALRRDARVSHVLEPRREALARVPNDTLYTPEQWWLAAPVIGSAGVPGLPSAWDRSTGAPASALHAPPVVAVLDSGYTPHPELDSKWLLPGRDFISDAVAANDGDGRDADALDAGDRLTQAEKDADPQRWDGCEVHERSSWHGTLMAGQIGAVSNNGLGVAGIHWALDSLILPVRVAGKCGAAVADVVDGLRWAGGLDVSGVPRNSRPAKVIVLGVAGFEPCDATAPDPNVAAAAQLYIDTLVELRAAGALVVAAAGNQRGSVGRPASCPGAFAVTALNRQGFKAFYANYGPQVALSTVGGDAANGRSCDDLLADTGLASTANDGAGPIGNFSYAAGSGTSFAAPVVAGVAALMWTVNPSLSVPELEDGLKRSARPHVRVPILQSCQATGNIGRCQCETDSCGAGILDADEALAYAAAPGAYQAPARSAVEIDSPAVRECAVRLGLPVPEPPASEPDPGPGGTGGGAVGFGWLLALTAGLGMLRRK